MDQPLPISRRRFHRLAGSSLGLTVTSASARGLGPEPANCGAMLPTPRTIKLIFIPSRTAKKRLKVIRKAFAEMP